VEEPGFRPAAHPRADLVQAPHPILLKNPQIHKEVYPQSLRGVRRQVLPPSPNRLDLPLLSLIDIKVMPKQLHRLTLSFPPRPAEERAGAVLLHRIHLQRRQIQAQQQYLNLRLRLPRVTPRRRRRRAIPALSLNHLQTVLAAPPLLEYDPLACLVALLQKQQQQ
jgi:hypothetical protein